MKKKDENEDSEDTEDSPPKVIQLNWWQSCITFMMSLLIMEYPYLHKMDNLCIDFKRKTIKYEQDHKRFDILQKSSGKIDEYILNEDTLKKLADIVAKKERQDESVKEKVDSLHSEMKKMKLSIEELKTLIRTSLTQNRL